MKPMIKNLAAGIFVTLTLVPPSYALQIKTAVDNEPIVANVSAQELTRIFVDGDRITSVTGIDGSYVLKNDEQQGAVFIKPTVSHLIKQQQLEQQQKLKQAEVAHKQQKEQQDHEWEKERLDAVALLDQIKQAKVESNNNNAAEADCACEKEREKENKKDCKNKVEKELQKKIVQKDDEQDENCGEKNEKQGKKEADKSTEKDQLETKTETSEKITTTEASGSKQPNKKNQQNKANEMKTNNTNLINIFIKTESGHNYVMFLNAVEMPAETIMLKPTKPASKLKTIKTAEQSSYEQTLVQLITDISNGKIPDDYTVTNVDQPARNSNQKEKQQISEEDEDNAEDEENEDNESNQLSSKNLVDSADVTLRTIYTNDNLMGQIYQVTNTSDKPITLSEQQFYKSDVRAIAIQNHHLAPLANTYVYVITQAL